VLEWIKQRLLPRIPAADTHVQQPAPSGRVMSGEYRSLHTYLDRRYADTVVLTFSEIEDLLGFSLPDLARLSRDWWTNADPSLVRDSWILARRTAVPNLPARSVVFERVS
jgi:hypothetical protein